MADALLGHTGFVGTSLLRQRGFEAGFDSATIESSAERPYELVVCAAAPGQKWRANREPDADRATLLRLQHALARLRCRRFVLISTVDVFEDSREADETRPAPPDRLQPYGRHRRELELFVAEHFDRATIVRLPGLVGPGLRKNAVFDLHHRHEVGKIDPRACFQFYPMVNLWSDLQQALAADLRLVHLTAEPIAMADVAREAFGVELAAPAEGAGPAASYDLRSLHGGRLGGRGAYLYDRREVLAAVRGYAQSEPRRAG